MIFQHSTSTYGHFLRTLVPSLASISLCGIGAICFVGGSIFLDSVNYGTILPNIADGDPATAYTNHIVQPVETVIHSVIWNNTTSIVLWSFAGVFIYELLDAGVRLFAEWRATSHDIQYINRRVIIKHPLEKSFFLRVIWRLGITIAAFMITLFLQPVLHSLFGSIHTIILAQDIGTILKDFLLSTLVWAILMHGIVVFLRLYTLRTRLFGDTTVYESSAKAKI